MKEQTNTKIYQYDGDEHRLSDLGLYFRNLDKALLTKEEEKSLFTRMNHGDLEAKKIIIESPFVKVPIFIKPYNPNLLRITPHKQAAIPSPIPTVATLTSDAPFTISASGSCSSIKYILPA